jgi:hypothetical protein
MDDLYESLFVMLLKSVTPDTTEFIAWIVDASQLNAEESTQHSDEVLSL